MVQDCGGESLMKKRTVEEKRQMVDNACKLLTEAMEKTREAKRLLHLCGIECCDGLNEDEIQDFNPYASNVQLYSGIKKMSGIIDTEPEFRPTYYDESKIDKSRCYIQYGGVTFLQIGDERTSTTAKFTFR